MFCRIGSRRKRTRHRTAYFVGGPVGGADPSAKHLAAPTSGNRNPNVNKSERKRRIAPQTTLYLWNAQTTGADQSQSDIKTTWFQGSPGPDTKATQADKGATEAPSAYQPISRRRRPTANQEAQHWKLRHRGRHVHRGKHRASAQSHPGHQRHLRGRGHPITRMRPKHGGLPLTERELLFLLELKLHHPLKSL